MLNLSNCDRPRPTQGNRHSAYNALILAGCVSETMTSFTITPLTNHTGAEVSGLDFRKPIEPQDRETLNRAFIDHHVLVIRDQRFTPEQFKSAAQVFGELQSHDKKEHHVPGHPDVSYVSNDEFVNGRRVIPGETFHTDHS